MGERKVISKKAISDVKKFVNFRPIRNNKTISDVVTTVLIILISIIAIIFLWQMIKHLSKPDIDTSSLTVSLSIKSAAINQNNLNIAIQRNPGKGTLEGVVFKVTDYNGESRTYTKTDSISELETKTYSLDISGLSVKSISIAGLFKSASGKNITGTILDTKTNFGPCQPNNNVCSGKECGSFANGTCGTISCGSCSGNCVNGICQAINSPQISIELLHPTENINVVKSQFFNFTLNISCANADCGNIDISLDPECSQYDSYNEDIRDGLYTVSGTCDGVNSYQSAGPYYLFRYDSVNFGSKVWIIATIGSCQDADVAYINYNSGDSVPLTNWQPGMANPPAPTFACAVNNAHYCVKDAGNDFSNGEYSVSGSCDGVNSYVNSNGKWLYRYYNGYGSFWYISDGNCQDGQYNYITTEGGPSPSALIWSTGGAPSPVPTITSGTCTNSGSSIEKTGLISTTTGATPFYTNATSNPWQISLNKDKSKVLVFWINTTGDYGKYLNFFAFANKTSNKGISSSTKKVDITIGCPETDLGNPNLVSLYHFNNDWNDTLGLNNGTTKSGNAKIDDTFYKLGGGAGQFLLEGDYLNLKSLVTSKTNDLTISAWVYTTNPASGNWQWYLIEGTSGGEVFTLGLSANGFLTYHKPGSVLDTSNFQLSANKWHHVVFTISPIGIWTYYLNGVADSFPKSYGNTNTPSGFARISHYAQSWKGYIDELAIYNKALSSEEISQLYNSQKC
jgi:hypothetical protein